MPFTIVRNDIVNMNVDAIVNSTSKDGLYVGGAEQSLLEIGGPNLDRDRMNLGYIDVSEAKPTKGYDLMAKYVIHTVGPLWVDEYPDSRLLKNTYSNVLQVAKEINCETIAFPLISSGTYGYPKRKALSIAKEVIMNFLSDNDMMIYLVVYDDESYMSSKDLFDNVTEYIEDNLVVEDEFLSADILSAPMYKMHSKMEYEVLENRLSNIDEGFSKTLLTLIEESGEKNSDIYNKANVDKKLFSKIKNNENYHPSKNIAICFAIALKLSLEETEDFIERAGYALSKSIPFDLIIEFCITSNIYDIFTINEILYDKDQLLLGSTMN